MPRSWRATTKSWPQRPEHPTQRESPEVRDDAVGVEPHDGDCRSSWLFGGWVHLIVGLVMLLAGIGVFSGNFLARTFGVIVAALSLIANFFFIPALPTVGAHCDHDRCARDLGAHRPWQGDAAGVSPVSGLGYPPSRPVVVACCTASLRDETPSFR
jgi:hypothetical protein